MIAGNCGFTLAPVAARRRRLPAPHDGEGRGHAAPRARDGRAVELAHRSPTTSARSTATSALNVGFLVGHCALRRNVMGADAIGNEATPEQLEAMVRLLHDVDRGRRPRLLDHAVVHPLRRRRPTGRVALGVERRSARAVPRGQRPRRHDARVRHRRLPARLHRRRSRVDGGDDARRAGVRSTGTCSRSTRVNPSATATSSPRASTRSSGVARRSRSRCRSSSR